jgi:hypothetical protein
MHRTALRTFASRDRDSVAALKREHHARRHRASRGSAGLQAAQVLREHARKVRPDWPTARDRDEDFARHVALKRKTDRAAHAFSAHCQSDLRPRFDALLAHARGRPKRSRRSNSRP